MENSPFDHQSTGVGAESAERLLSPAEVTPEWVLSWLEENFHMIAETPQFAAIFSQNEKLHNEGVINFQQRRAERLQESVHDLQQQNRRIIATVRHNYLIQGRVHRAIIELIATQSLERLLGLLTGELAGILGLDALGLCVETGGSARISERLLSFPRVRKVPPDAIVELLGGEIRLLRAVVIGDPGIFGVNADKIRSDALLRLDLGQGAPVVLLALGARRPGIFFHGQNTALLQHFTEVVTLTLHRHLKELPS
ncbi:MAG: DUF484 family protein [Alphaproteobacteria bacterium]|nr:DUF484 family protein [Alphaproteobacteria bacterium]